MYAAYSFSFAVVPLVQRGLEAGFIVMRDASIRVEGQTKVLAYFDFQF
jgi:hypothetical protein